MKIHSNPLLINESVRRDIDLKLQSIDTEAEFVDRPIDVEHVSKMLLNSEIDVVTIPLICVPLKKNPDLKIWALLPRSQAKNVLMVRNDICDMEKRIPLKQSSKVYCPGEFIDIGFKKIRGDISFEAKDISQLVLELSKGDLKAGIIPQEFIDSEIKEEYQTIDLHEREFGHIAGQGSVAMIAMQDSPFANHLRMFYDQKTVVISNTERLIKSKVEGKVNVHVEIDDSGHFHVWVLNENHGELKKVHFSQSTRNGIIDKVISELKS